MHKRGLWISRRLLYVHRPEDIVVLGISPDTITSQADFSEKYGFQYPLLADADHKVAKSYGVWNSKKLLFLGVACQRASDHLFDR